MNRQQLTEQIKKKRSLLCIGLDTDPKKIPSHLHHREDPVFEFNKAIIDATHQHAVAYKPNTAFYESNGLKGWQSLEKTINYLNDNYPEVFTIADAKRGDIGNTSTQYAKAFFETLNFDSVTVAPYMGSDSVKPFLEFKGKWVILLGLTSNSGATDFQTTTLRNFNISINEVLFERVLRISRDWGTEDNMMYVIGATKAKYLQRIRKLVPNHFLLIPGVGAQGGDLNEVLKYGLNPEAPNLLINSSRGIIYASSEMDFANTAAERASELHEQMKAWL